MRPSVRETSRARQWGARAGELVPFKMQTRVRLWRSKASALVSLLEFLHSLQMRARTLFRVFEHDAGTASLLWPANAAAGSWDRVWSVEDTSVQGPWNVSANYKIRAQFSCISIIAAESMQQQMRFLHITCSQTSNSPSSSQSYSRNSSSTHCILTCTLAKRLNKH